MFEKLQTDNHNLKKNVTMNEKKILKKMGLKFHKILFYIYFVIKCELLWSYEAMMGRRCHYGTGNSG